MIEQPRQKDIDVTLHVWCPELPQPVCTRVRVSGTATAGMCLSADFRGPCAVAVAPSFGCCETCKVGKLSHLFLGADHSFSGLEAIAARPTGA